MKQHFLAMATATLVAFGANAAATTTSTTNNVGASPAPSAAPSAAGSKVVASVANNVVPTPAKTQGAASQSSNADSSTVSGATVSSTVVPKTNVDKSTMVKCYGIALKGQNDCASANGLHGCAAEAGTNYDPCEWKAVTLATCNAGVKNLATGAMVKGSQSPINCQVDAVPAAPVAAPTSSTQSTQS